MLVEYALSDSGGWSSGGVEGDTAGECGVEGEAVCGVEVVDEWFFMRVLGLSDVQHPVWLVCDVTEGSVSFEEGG